MVIVGPYLIKLSWQSCLKGCFELYFYICHFCLTSDVKVVKRDYILTLALYIVYHILTRTILHATQSSDICRSGINIIRSKYLQMWYRVRQNTFCWKNVRRKSARLFDKNYKVDVNNFPVNNLFFAAIIFRGIYSAFR